MKFPTLDRRRQPGRCPPGAVITSAVLQVNCTNAGNSMRLYRLTQDWVEDQATWNERASRRRRGPRLERTAPARTRARR